MSTSDHSSALGDILQRTSGLTPEQIQQALAHQRSQGGRFGEAVVALGLARQEDVVWALAQQFHYPYQPADQGQLNAELVVANQPFLDSVEHFRQLRSQLLLGPLAQRRALSIVSAEPGDGRSFVAANLAVAFSQLAGRTLLIDADLRHGRQHQIFGAEAVPGLSGILAGRCEPNVITPAPHLPNLYLLPAGARSPNPAELLHRPALGLLLQDLLQQFDHVLIDTPAASNGPDARIVASHSGVAMVIGRRDHSKVGAMQALVKQLSSSNVTMAGVLVNDFRQ